MKNKLVNTMKEFMRLFYSLRVIEKIEYGSKNFKPYELEINGLKKSMMSLLSDTIISEPGQRSRYVQVVTVRCLYKFLKELDSEAIEIKTRK